MRLGFRGGRPILCDIRELGDDGDVVRAGTLTLAAADAGVRGVALLSYFGQRLAGLLNLSLSQAQVLCCKDLGDGNLLWTACTGVVADRAGYAGRAAHEHLRLCDGVAFLLVERPHVLHEAEVVLHLLHVRHAREHRKHARQGRRKAQRP